MQRPAGLYTGRTGPGPYSGGTGCGKQQPGGAALPNARGNCGRTRAALAVAACVRAQAGVAPQLNQYEPSNKPDDDATFIVLCGLCPVCVQLYLQQQGRRAGGAGCGNQDFVSESGASRCEAGADAPVTSFR